MDKIYIFLSHSHKDIGKVRIIRDYFEKLKYEPILFYLKCLEDEDEITDLIKREIKARQWFIYCKSENSEKSKWVKSELMYQVSLGKTNLFTIDLKSNILDQLKIASKRLFKASSIFLSYSAVDKEISSTIHKILEKKDFNILSVGDISQNWSSPISNSIYKSDIFLFLFTLKSIKNNNFQIKEYFYALDINKIVIPVLILENTNNFTFSSIPIELQSNQMIVFNINNIDNSINDLVRRLINVVNNKY